MFDYCYNCVALVRLDNELGSLKKNTLYCLHQDEFDYIWTLPDHYHDLTRFELTHKALIKCKLNGLRRDIDYYQRY